MVKYYIEVLVDNLSICLDTDVWYYHLFKVGDLITIHSYSDEESNSIVTNKKVLFGSSEYDAEFTLDCLKICSARLPLNGCLTRGYMVDVTKNIYREKKLEQLGI